MNSAKTKAPKPKPTFQEVDFERKVEMTRQYLNRVRTNEDKYASKNNRDGAYRSSKRQFSPSQLQELVIRDNTARNSQEGDAAYANSEIDLNVNVKFTTSTNQTKMVKKISRRLNNSNIKQTLRDPKRIRELQNTSLSKMLDNQLLVRSSSHETSQVPTLPNVSTNVAVTESTTKNIFHGDKIYLQEGRMGFKPLELETNVIMPSRLKLQSTNQSIVPQEKLESASIEDFISLRKQQNLSEFDQKIMKSALYEPEKAERNGSLHLTSFASNSACLLAQSSKNSHG